ncbi:MAG: FtsB family cell division protein [Bacilli bacterium]
MARKKKGKTVITFGLLFFTVITTTMLFNLSKTYFEYVKMKRDNEKVKISIKKEKEVAKELEDVISKLNDPNYLKTYAKENYLYSEDGTIIIRIPDEKEE